MFKDRKKCLRHQGLLLEDTDLGELSKFKFAKEVLGEEHARRHNIDLSSNLYAFLHF